MSKKIRNVAIVAHIDHGKTTLLDCLLNQSQVFRDNEKIPERVMDSYDQERERGITIFSKNTAVPYKDFQINIIDTPGHSDFSGEVERILGMVNSVLLLVDAQEGPMPQTRFVLSKALKMGLRPIVVVNKIDKPNAQPETALDKTFDLFVELGANDEQLDFPFCYASGVGGFACREVDDPRENMAPLFDMIVEHVPEPPGDENKPFLFQAMTIGYNDFVGRQATGRILEGIVKKGDRVICKQADGTETRHSITRVESFEGLRRIEVSQLGAGDIAILSGIPEIQLGDALCNPENVVQLPAIRVDEPTVEISLTINHSPMAGREGKHVTFNKIKDRLLREKRSNISLDIKEVSGQEEAMSVAGRGELHLAVLIEAMRREGYELSLSKPQVVIKQIDGQKCEPIERVYVEVPQEFSGGVIEELSRRKGEMQSLHVNEHDIASMEFLLPTRGLMGYRNEFLTATRGLGILTSVFDSFKPWVGEIPKRKNGVLISLCGGKANSYASFTLQNRGSLFTKPGDEVYEGMVVGQHNRDNDLVVNITKAKQLTNFRASGNDESLTLTPPKVLTLEEAIDFIEDDELVEVTPITLRLRKRVLSESDRKRQSRSK